MVSTSKIKSVDFYRKIPRDLTEASLSGAGLSIVAALAMVFLFGMELSSFLAVNTSTSVIVDKSSDGDFLNLNFNISFPALSCEFASVDVSDVLGTHRLNITKTVRKIPIDPSLRGTGAEFHSTTGLHLINHGDEDQEEEGENSYASVPLTNATFDKFSHHFQVLVVNFYAPWCYWSNRLKPSWAKAAEITRQKYDLETDGRVLLASVDCTEESALCKRNHVQGYPSIRIFRKGNDLMEDHGQHEHESYYGDRDTESLVKMVEGLLKPIKKEDHKDGKFDNAVLSIIKKAPVTSGCRIEGFVRAKKVPGELVISAFSGAHSFDSSQMNMSHFVTHFSFGKMIDERLLTDMKRLLPYFGLSHDRLNGKSFINQRRFDANVTIEHYLQIVKTEVVSRRYGREHSVIEEYEYTAHSNVAHSYHTPVAKFHFELSPMQVLISEDPRSFSHFITNVCAIIGGVFTVAGILDSIFQSTVRMVKKKIELGKNI